jgi:hypothetical protein
MKLKSIAVAFALLIGALAPAQAQRGSDPWELLGEEKVGFGNERDVINIGRSEDYFRNRSYRRLRFLAERGEVRLKSVRLVFLNGHSEDVDISKTLKPGQAVDVDLRGERSYLRQIEMNYQSKFGISIGGGGLKIAQPTVKVFGENRRGGGEVVVQRPPRPTMEPGWSEIAREGFDRRDERVVIRIGRGEGRFGQIRFVNDGDRVDIRDVSIRFGNGQTQNVRLDQSLEEGRMTRPIDVEGDRRSIESLTVRLTPRGRPGQAELVVFGTERPGRDDGSGPVSGGGRRDWQLLGEQSVGFGVDRDVIRINQSEDFYRNKGFDKLHFVAEGNEVHMMAIRVVYINGETEDMRIDRLIQRGGDLTVDLPGRRSYLRAVEMTYRTRPGFNGRAVVKVFGEAAAGGRR